MACLMLGESYFTDVRISFNERKMISIMAIDIPSTLNPNVVRPIEVEVALEVNGNNAVNISCVSALNRHIRNHLRYLQI